MSDQPDRIARIDTQQATHSRLAAALVRIRIAARDGDHQPDPTTRLKQIIDLVESTLADDVAQLRREYGIWWHTSGDSSSIALGQEKIGSLAAALRIGPTRVGPMYGITHYTTVYCDHVTFGDGSTWISNWEPVDHRGPLFPCPDCGRTVFQGSTTDNSAFLIDAEPADDGELVLIPNVEHGGEPGAIYGEDDRPGVLHYRRHFMNCSYARTHA